MEFYAGLTPGYIVGESSAVSKSSWGDGFRCYKESWTEKSNSFSKSADAGFNLNFRIWRFDLKLMPAFHYNVLDNYKRHTTTGDKVIGASSNNVKPLNRFFSMSGGLAFYF